MLVRPLRPILFSMLLLVGGACTDAATAPDRGDIALEPVELALESMTRGESPPSGSDVRVPTLQRILHEAIAKVRAEQGDAAARRLIAPIQELLAQARAAREAKNVALARQRLHEANLHAARVIVQVFPGAASRLIADLSSRRGDLDDVIAEREAAGADVTALRRAAEAAATLHAQATHADAAGARARAVLLAAHGLDVIRRAMR